MALETVMSIEPLNKKANLEFVISGILTLKFTFENSAVQIESVAAGTTLFKDLEDSYAAIRQWVSTINSLIVPQEGIQDVNTLKLVSKIDKVDLNVDFNNQEVIDYKWKKSDDSWDFKATAPILITWASFQLFHQAMGLFISSIKNVKKT